MTSAASKVKCGDCRYFVRDGNCGFLASEAGRAKDRPYAHAPFWVWSDCYSDKEQVRSTTTSACPVFEELMTPDKIKLAEDYLAQRERDLCLTSMCAAKLRSDATLLQSRGLPTGGRFKEAALLMKAATDAHKEAKRKVAALALERDACSQAHQNTKEERE